MASARDGRILVQREMSSPLVVVREVALQVTAQQALVPDDDLHRLPPVQPDTPEQHPDQPIGRTEARSFRGALLQHGELMTEREDFRRELEPRTDRGPKRGQQGDEQAVIVLENGIRLWPATATATTRTEYSIATVRFLRGDHGDVPRPLRFRGVGGRHATDPPLECDRTSDGGMDGAAIPHSDVRR